MTIKKQRPRHRNCCFLVSLLLVLSPIFQTWVRAQTPQQATSTDQKVDSLSQILRLEKTEVSGGAQLLTVHARLLGLESNKAEAEQWVPLVSILRDTLGDPNRENDRLRYVWPLTYTTPTLKQRFAAAIPFFYTRVGNKNKG